MMAPISNNPFLEAQDIKTYFPIEKGILIKRRVGSVKAIDGVSFSLEKGKILGLVGESGCGKSTLARTLLQLIPPTSGAVRINGQEVTSLRAGDLRSARKDFQMVFQDPYASLNPRMTIFDTLREALTNHKKIPAEQIQSEVSTLMDKVGLAARYLKKYPHEFSGGQRQRIAIARALAVDPKLIIADEPVSALDVSIQSQILNLLAKLCREMDLTMIFISHDLSVVRYIADDIAVMYLGRLVEMGPADEVYYHPKHPYTQALISAVPLPDPDLERQRQRIILSGDPPSPTNPPAGCSFHPRCAHAKPECSKKVPVWEWSTEDQTHRAACFRVSEIEK